MPDLETLAEYLKQNYDPILPSVPKDALAYTYLASHGCLTLGGIMDKHSLFKALSASYPGVITNGITDAEMDTLIPSSHPARAANVKPSWFTPDRWIIVPGDEGVLNTRGPSAGLARDLGTMYIELAKKNPTNEEELVKVLEGMYDNTRELFDLFSTTALSSARLTALGIALGHANLVQKVQMGADLSIWIK